MAKLYYQQPGEKKVPKKHHQPRAWLWKRLLVLSLIMNLGLISWIWWKHG